MDTAISTDGLTRSFGGRVVVDDLTFDVPRGGVTGFLGPNGSGKSTTIRLLLGLVSPTAGTATVLGSPLGRPSAYTHRIGALIDSPALYPGLSATENLRVHAELAGLPGRRTTEVLDRVGLHGRGRDRVRSFSLGMKQRLAIGIALLRDPELLVLDEPTNGLDPEGIVEIRTLLRELGAQDRTVLVSSHVLAEMQAACDRFVVIRDGSLVFSGTAADLLAAGPARVVLRPERPDDLAPLEALLRLRQMPVERAGSDLVVGCGTQDAGELNRLAFEHGIVLAEVIARSADLEDVFIHLTRKASR